MLRRLLFIISLSWCSLQLASFLRKTEHSEEVDDDIRGISLGQGAFFHCDKSDFKPRSGIYTVYLTSGHSLEQHFAAIQEDISPYIRSTINDELTHRTIYHTENIDLNQLSAIRSDKMVYLVQCGLHHDANSRYEAPLLCNMSSEDLVPQSYGVFLSPGWTLENHFEAIGRNLTSHIRWVWDRTIVVDQVVYHAERIDDGLLAKIGDDRYVDTVSCDYRVHIDE
jgi:hypothetical protein